MCNILGLDLGSKTIGMASSNGKIAKSEQTIRFEEWNFDDALEQLSNYLKDKNYNIFVFGYPKNMDNSIGERAEMVDYFIDGFMQYNPHLNNDQVIRIDERRTTKMAKSIMIEAGLSRKKQKTHKDSLAAQLILELYLQSNAKK